MKINDAVWGALLLLLSAAVFNTIRTFPVIPGQQVGPAMFPGAIAAGLAICGSLLIAKGFAARAAGGRWASVEDWVRSPRHVLAFVLVIGVNVFYILAVDTLGFIVTGTLYLAVLFATFGVRLKWNLLLALLITLAVHYAFYKLLKVPLPWGLLTAIAW